VRVSEVQVSLKKSFKKGRKRKSWRWHGGPKEREKRERV